MSMTQTQTTETSAEKVIKNFSKKKKKHDKFMTLFLLRVEREEEPLQITHI